MIDQFVSCFRTLRLKLAQSGTHLKEQEACIKFLSALPPSYSGFVTSQNAVLRMAETMAVAIGMDESNIPSLTVNELIGALMQEESSRLAAKTTNKSLALFVAKGGMKGAKKPYGKQQAKMTKAAETSTVKKRFRQLQLVRSSQSLGKGMP